MPHACGRRAWSARGYRRIARRGRSPFRSATRVSRKARRPMRLLHARLHHGIGRPAASQPAPQRGRHPAGAGQQHLPLHWLRQNHRGGEVRCRAQRRRGGAVNEIVPTHNIGGYVPMVDGPEKVSGRAKYTADLINPGMLAGHIFRSPYSHAEIIDVDVSAALQLPGVKAVVTGADATAKRAIALIKLTVRELPAYYTSQEAMAEGATTIHARKAGNIERDVLFELGNVERGIQGADLVREGR